MSRERPTLDLSEKGRRDGQPISLDRRLFMQFLAFGECRDSQMACNALQEADVQGVLYVDLNDPTGIGLLTLSEEPDWFVDTLRSVLVATPFRGFLPKPEYTMLGRTYTLGYESDLEDALLDKPRQKVLSAQNRWAVWYPLRREKRFETLPEEEQHKVLGEHGSIGMAFGRAGYATDIRLTCHGLDKNDNDFVIGLLGRELYPLSACVQAMRKTKQTSQHLESLGPFFIGRTIWQSK